MQQDNIDVPMLENVSSALHEVVAEIPYLTLNLSAANETASFEINCVKNGRLKLSLK
jgi:hypothetical protein